MRKLILAVILGLTVNANAERTVVYDYTPNPRDAWRFTSEQAWDANTYYIDENGYTQTYDNPIGYTNWTDIDENLYDYEVKIRLK